jgi:hypothetical protein
MDALTAVVAAWNRYSTGVAVDPSTRGNMLYWEAWFAFAHARDAVVGAYTAAGLHKAAHGLDVVLGALDAKDRGLALDVATLAARAGAV